MYKNIFCLSVLVLFVTLFLNATNDFPLMKINNDISFKAKDSLKNDKSTSRPEIKNKKKTCKFWYTLFPPDYRRISKMSKEELKEYFDENDVNLDDYYERLEEFDDEIRY